MCTLSVHLGASELEERSQPIKQVISAYNCSLMTYFRQTAASVLGILGKLEISQNSWEMGIWQNSGETLKRRTKIYVGILYNFT